MFVVLSRKKENSQIFNNKKSVSMANIFWSVATKTTEIQIRLCKQQKYTWTLLHLSPVHETVNLFTKNYMLDLNGFLQTWKGTNYKSVSIFSFPPKNPI